MGWTTSYHQQAIQELIDHLCDPHMCRSDAENGLDVDRMAMAVHRLQQAIEELREAERSGNE